MLNKADIQFAVKAYLKEVGPNAVEMPIIKLLMKDFLEFVEEL